MKKFLSVLTILFLSIVLTDAFAQIPTTQAYNIAFSNVGKTQLRLVLTRGDGAYRIVVAKQTNNTSTVALPTNGNDYTASSTFGSGSSLGSSTFVVYKGTDRAVTVSGLSPGLPYSFRVYEFNGTGTGTNYLTTTAANNPRWTFTRPADPNNATTTNVTDVRFQANWQQPSEGDWEGYDLEVATDSSFNNLLTDYNPAEIGIDLDPTPYYIVEGLSANTVYYWRVRDWLDNRVSDWIYPTAVTTRPVAPTVPAVTICQGTTAVLRPTAPDTTTHTFRYYSANTGGTPLGTGLSFTTGTLTTTTTFYVTSVNNNTNMESATRTAVVVTVNPSPTPHINRDTVVCANSTGSVYTTASVSGNTYSWTITGGTITAGSNTNSITVSWGNSGTGVLMVTQTSSSNCVGYDTVNIRIQALPTPHISGQSTLCVNESGATYSVTNNAGNSYTWTITGGTITSGQGTRLISVDWGSGTTGRVSVTETTTASCSGRDTMNVTLQPIPTPAITGTTTVCANTTGSTYSTTFHTGNTYSWTVTGGSISGRSDSSTVMINWGAAGTGTLSVTEMTSASCSGTANVNVTIQAIPAPSITGAATVCASSMASAYSTTLNTGNTYSWTVTGGTISGSSTGNSILVNWGGAGSGTVRVTELTTASCSTSVTMNVTIQGIPTPHITGTSTVCANSTGNIYSTTNNTGNTYLWTITGGTISGSTTGNSVTVNWGVAGTARLTVREMTSGGCTAYDTLNTTIQAIPTPHVTGTSTVCANSTSNIYSTTNNTGNTYLWTITGGTISGSTTGNSVTVNWGGAGSAMLVVREMTSGSCTTYDTLNVTIQAVPTPHITGTSTVCANTTNSIFSTTSTTNTFSWTVTGGTIIGNNTGNSITINWGTGSTGRIIVSESTTAGCLTRDTMNITIQALPTPHITGTDSVCANAGSQTYSISTTSNTVSWMILGGTITSGQNTRSINVTWFDTTTAGRLAVTETTTQGCFGVDTMRLTIFPVPATAIEGNNNVCANDVASLFHTTNDYTNIGNTYTWTVTGGSIASGQGTAAIRINWGSAGSGSVSVVERTVNGCSVTANKSVTINPLPTPNITGTFNVCQNSQSTYSVTNVATHSYSWSVTGGTISGSSTGSSVTINWGGARTSVVTVTEMDTLGCSTTNNHSVVVYATPTPHVAGTTSSCVNNNIVYTTTNNTGNTYTWTVTGGSVVSGGSTNAATINWMQAGTNRVIVMETNPAGCSARDTLTVTIQAFPTPDIRGVTAACVNTVTGYSTNRVTGNTYSWTITGGSFISSSTSDTITVRWGVAGNGRLIVTEMSAFGCTTNDTINVTVNPLPTPAVSGVMAVCAQETGVPYKTTRNSGSTYSWTITGGTIATGAGTDSITVNWGAAGSGSVAVTETSSSGCTASATANVTVRPLPTPSITGNNHVCENTSYTYSTANNAGSTYQWIVDQGTVVSGQGTATAVIRWNAIGDTVTNDGTVSVRETFSTGCAATANVNVLIHPFPRPDITGSTNVCSNTTVTYSSRFTIGNTYVWSITGGSITSGSGTASITVRWGSAGTGRLILTETIPTGCSTSDTANVTIQTAPTPHVTGLTAVCANRTGVIYTTTNSGNIFNWTVTGGTISGSSTGNSVTINFGNSGTARVVVTESTTAGCSISDTAVVTVNPLPAPSIAGSTTVCANSSNVQYSTTNNTGSTYSWTVTGGTVVSGAGTSSIMVNWGSGTSGSLSVTETSAAGCSTQVSSSITIQAIPAPSITGPTSVVTDTSYTFTTTNNSANTYSWTLSGGTIMSGQNTNQVTVRWSIAGTYTLTVTESTSGGCTNTSTATITVRRVNEPVKLAFTSNIGTQVSGTPFNVTVQSQTQGGTPANLDVNTPITISVNTGTGTVTGSGTITAGTNSTTISVTYTKTGGETGVVLTADDGTAGLNPATSNAFTVIASEPSQATNIDWGNFDTTSISLNWSNGGGTGRIVLAKQTSSFGSAETASDGTTYTANSVFGQGSQIGNAYVVYNGTGSSVTVTGLQRNTRYWFKVLEYNGSGSTINYNNNAVTNNPRSRFTAPRIPFVDNQSSASNSGLVYMSGFAPNPTKDRINFNIQLSEDQEVTIQLLTLTGQKILEPIQDQFFSSGLHEINIPVQNIAAGTYIVMVNAGSELVMDKIMILP